MSQFTVGTLTVPFKMIAKDEFSGFSTWAGSEPHVVTRHIPGSEHEIVQNMGRGNRQITFEAWFEDHDHHDSMCDLVGDLGMLILRGDFPYSAVLMSAGDDPIRYDVTQNIRTTLVFREVR
jgi:hypothetical protein